MNRIFRLVSLATVILSFMVCGVSIADDALSQPVSIYSKVCQEKLYSYPKSPFKLAVYCDDALGTNVGVIFHEPGTDWYWSDPEWALDVTAFYWGKKGEHLFISTSSVYGTGKIYELDLKNRKYKNIIPVGFPPTDGNYDSIILKYNIDTDSLECMVKYFHREKKETTSDIINISIR